jgi:hypothetical protein
MNDKKLHKSVEDVGQHSMFSKSIEIEELQKRIDYAKAKGANFLRIYHSTDGDGDFESYDLLFQKIQLETDEEHQTRIKDREDKERADKIESHRNHIAYLESLKKTHEDDLRKLQEKQ